jgi:excisionase family DNA binding protein
MYRNDNDQKTEPSFDPRAFGLLKVAYSINETLEQLSIGRTTLYELVDRGDLKITKLGRKSLVYAVDLAALLNKLRQSN